MDRETWELSASGGKGNMEKYVIGDGQQQRSIIIADNCKLISSVPLNKTRFLSWKLLFCELFLPKGYPRSVSGDYMQYQSWDTIQAFASSLTSALATEAVLRGAGVGDEKASVLAATVAWLLKDGLGMISRIWFSWFSTSKLDCECKKWRLIADGLNDLAFLMDLTAPMFPPYFTVIICMSSVARSVVGVAGCATRSAITQHQAILQNVADVAAKDAAQETFVNIFALLYSLILLPIISGHYFTIWVFYFIFTFVHLYANYRAVMSLKFKTFNPNLLYVNTRNYVENGTVLSIDEANAREPLFWSLPGKRFYGHSLASVLKEKSFNAKSFMKEEYAVLYQDDPEKPKTVTVAVSSSCGSLSQLHAAFYGEYAMLTGNFPSNAQVEDFFNRCRNLGWEFSHHRLAFDQWTYMKKHD